MSFKSFEFFVFLTVVFILYWFVRNQKLKFQNTLLLLASYFFYGWWDWRFLFLLIFLSLLNFLIGIRIDKNEADGRKKIWLITGLIFNFGILGIFKYYNFFVDSFIDLISVAGYDLSRSTTKIILPLGISFYIFLSISYIIDVYKHKLTANRNIIEVLLSLSFFPIILAGPLQRPNLLLPQISQKRTFDHEQATDGLRQILWGLFAKVVIADNLGTHVDDIFSNYSEYSGSTLAIGAGFYAIQIYADFSGYSNMAIGIAKLFGFRLIRNFAYPYFSRDITEFWKRWHISLTTWFRDYVFLPISFAVSWKIKGEKVLLIKSDLFIYIIASLITWSLTGLWHGANYTFIIWGFIHGFFLIVYQWQRKPRKKLFKKFGIDNDHTLVVFTETIITMSIVIIAWIFFRSNNPQQAFEYISELFSPTLLTLPKVHPVGITLLTALFIFLEWSQRNKEHALQIENISFRILRWSIYYGVVLLILLFTGGKQEFIYSQF